MQASFAGQRILVTGATGFVGGHAGRALRRRGAEVIALVRGESPREGRLGEESPWDIPLRGDILDPASLEPALVGVQSVVHCAGLVGPGHPSADYHRVNVEGTKNLLDGAVRAGVGRFLYVSSVGVYALGRARSLSEDDVGSRTGDPYGDSKLRAEAICSHAQRHGRIALTIVRPVIVYGPGDTGFLPFLVKALRAGRFGFVGDGLGPVHLVHVDDLADLIVRCLESPAAIGRAYNACGPDAISWRELVERVIGPEPVAKPRTIPRWAALSVASVMELGSALRLTSRTPIARNVVRAMTDPVRFETTRALEELGWTPARRFDDAFEEARDFVLHRMAATASGPAAQF